MKSFALRDLKKTRKKEREIYKKKKLYIAKKYRVQVESCEESSIRFIPKHLLASSLIPAPPLTEKTFNRLVCEMPTRHRIIIDS